jgi:hypothetical protein
MHDDHRRCHHHQLNPTREERVLLLIITMYHEAMIFALLVFISSLSIGHRLPSWEWVVYL